MLAFVSCKKGEEGVNMYPQSSFSYDSYSVPKEADATASKSGNNLTFTLTQPGMDANLPRLVFQIHNFHGTGTYSFADGEIQVYGQKGNHDTYWRNDWKGEWTTGTVRITRCDDVLIAEAQGMLSHTEVNGSDVEYTQTSFRAFIHQKFMEI
jgi:hypothetical protein